MSADNGIYILNLKDQSRVIHTQAIDNLWWNYVINGIGDNFVPTRIVEYFSNAIPMTNEKAIAKACEMEKDYPILEYGMVNFNIDKTWDEIVNEAKGLAMKEILAIKNRPDKEWKNNLSWYISSILTLESILDIRG
jgi:hypothetical protein